MSPKAESSSLPMSKYSRVAQLSDRRNLYILQISLSQCYLLVVA